MICRVSKASSGSSAVTRRVSRFVCGITDAVRRPGRRVTPSWLAATSAKTLLSKSWVKVSAISDETDRSE